MALFGRPRKKVPTLEDIRNGWEFDPTINDDFGGSSLSPNGPPDYPGQKEQMAQLTADLPAGAADAAPAMPKKKSGFFKNFLVNFAGFEGDALTGNSNFADNMKSNRQLEADQAKYEKHQQAEYDQAIKLYEYKRDHPDAPNPTELERYMTAGGIAPESQQGKDLFRQAAETKANPPLIQNVPGVGLVTMPRPASQPGAPPQQSVDYLKQHPETSHHFDQRYGPGAAARILGGAGPSNGPSGFPGY